jgi:N-acetylglutamate synthase-like GNAT family acetyltransferase
MNIIELDEGRVPLYCVCLEDWSGEIKEAGQHKETWYHQMKQKGLRVKLALDDQGNVGGMIQTIPIEHAFADGKNLYFILCIWVHGHKQGRGNFQRKGMGTNLLEAAEADARSLGAGGIAAWGLLVPAFMRASWFKKHGYRTADRQGIRVLLWKQFTADAVPPKWIRRKRKPEAEPGRVSVMVFRNGWCPAMNMAFERAKRAANEAEFAGKTFFQEIDTSDRAEYLRWGISDALFINGREIRTGPPPSYEKIRKRIQKQAKKLG